MSRPEDTASAIALNDHTVVHDGFRRYSIYRFRHRAMDDPERWEPETSRELVNSPRAAAIVAYDRKLDVLVLLRQFRLGAHLSTGRGNMIEIAAGAIDAGEAPDEAARRELKEETGLDALSIRHVLDFTPSPGVTDERIHFYFAEVDSSHLPELVGHDADEIIRPFRCAPEEAIAAADKGLITNAFTLLALNWFDRWRRGLIEGDTP